MNLNYSKGLLKSLDKTLLFVTFMLFVISVMMVSSTTTSDATFHFTKEVIIQIVAYFLGIGTLLFVLTIDYSIFENFEKLLYIFSILILLTVYVPGLGIVQYGARGWIKLGPLNFEPSEIVKITFILMFAKYLSRHSNELDTFKGLLKAGLYASPLILLVLIEPDLGNAIVLSFSMICMIFCAGVDYKLFAKASGLIVISFPLLYKLMKAHQKVRIDAFLNPDNLSLPGNYQVWNAKVAIGSGGFWGKGLFQGTQKMLNYIPVAKSDFIFAVIGEELGLIGGTIIIILYLIFLYRLINISRTAKDFYGSIVSIGIISMFGFQIFENVGMTMGLMPVAGITLPFISYGGSSILTNMIALGIVLNIGIRNKLINF